MAEVDTASLCQWRWNPVSGHQMREALSRRGAKCGDAPVARQAVPQAEPMDAQSGSAASPLAAESTAAPAPLPRPSPAPPERRPLPVGAVATGTPVTPFCAARSVRGPGEGQNGFRTSVAFSNRCAFPILVRYAEHAGDGLTGRAGPLQPGEASRYMLASDDHGGPDFEVYRLSQPR
jgi:hypothetical protein